MEKILPSEIEDIQEDKEFDRFRMIKTLCLIMIIFCIGIICQNNYSKMIENSRYMRFYPAATVFYEDYSDAKDFEGYKKLPIKAKTISYGIFKDDYGEDKFLIVAKTEEEDSAIIEKRRYSMFSQDGYTFISDSDEELKDLQKNIDDNSYEFIRNKSIKKLIKHLDESRDYTMVISDVSYVDLPVKKDEAKIINKVFDKASFQIFKTDKGYEFIGEITFKNKIASLATSIKNLSKKLDTRTIKIKKFDLQDEIMLVGVKDFDLWSKVAVKVAKTLPEDRYNGTVKFMQSIFNSDIEQDIVQKLNGNAVFYLYKERRILHPMLVLETKKDLAKQAKKYLKFLQISNNNSSLSEKELQNKTFNVIKSGFYPHNLSFGNVEENMFILGHQSIIEKYLEEENPEIIEENCDFYLLADLKRTPIFYNKRGFWRGYKNLELKIYLSPNVNIVGKLEK